MRLLNRFMYLLFCISILGIILSLIFIISCGVIRIITGSAVTFLMGWRVGILGDFIVLALLSSFLSNQLDKLESYRKKH